MSASDTSQAALAGYDRLIRRRLLLLAVMTCGIAISFVVDLASGPSRLPIADVLAALRGTAAADAPASIIVWEIRLPAAIMAILVGAALALAGAEMQTTLDNALASPFTLGMASAATFGAALWIVAGLSVPGIPDDWMLPLNAFLCALGSVFLLQAAARSRQAGPETLVLFGIALFFTFNALVAILQFVASDQALQQLVFWTMGSLSRADWTTIRLLGLALVVVVPFAMMAAWKMTALRLGDERARSFGIDVAKLRWYSLVRISVLTATSVAFVGTIAFVGLVGPHLARLVIGEDHRFFLPASMVAGALVMSLASVVSKTLIPGVEIPIGLVTALIGVPFFVSVVIGRRRG
nr:MAG: iron ABC transporter permease [Acidobacteriota bacterium]